MLPSLEKWIGLASRLPLVSHAREFLHRGSPYPEEPACETVVDKTYRRPVATRLTAEQARLVLIGYATFGDRGALDLMNAVFLHPSEQCQSVGCPPGGNSPDVFGRSVRDCA
jgi:hypothetical protein